MSPPKSIPELQIELNNLKRIGATSEELASWIHKQNNPCGFTTNIFILLGNQKQFIYREFNLEIIKQIELREKIPFSTVESEAYANHITKILGYEIVGFIEDDGWNRLIKSPLPRMIPYITYTGLKTIFYGAYKIIKSNTS